MLAGCFPGDFPENSVELFVLEDSGLEVHRVFAVEAGIVNVSLQRGDDPGGMDLVAIESGSLSFLLFLLTDQNGIDAWQFVVAHAADEFGHREPRGQDVNSARVLFVELCDNRVDGLAGDVHRGFEFFEAELHVRLALWIGKPWPQVLDVKLDVRIVLHRELDPALVVFDVATNACAVPRDEMAKRHHVDLSGRERGFGLLPIFLVRPLSLCRSATAAVKLHQVRVIFVAGRSRNRDAGFDGRNDATVADRYDPKSVARLIAAIEVRRIEQHFLTRLSIALAGRVCLSTFDIGDRLSDSDLVIFVGIQRGEKSTGFLGAKSSIAIVVEFFEPARRLSIGWRVLGGSRDTSH